ncbi:cell death-inducing p53-target protein 1-like [Crassostrea virginica]
MQPDTSTDLGMTDNWDMFDYHKPEKTLCPHCQQIIQPVVVYKRGFLPFLVCCFMFMTCILAIFACLPCFDKRLKTIIHICPSCNREIRRLTRM